MIACLGLLALGTTLPAVDRKNEWDSMERIVEPFLEGRVEQLPFSFRYGGVSSRDCIGGWEQTKSIQEVDARRTKVSIKFLDPATGLEVRAEAVIYRGYPASEWVLWFRNASDKPTPLLTDVNPLDLRLPTSDAAEPILSLHYSRGTNVDGEHLPGADDLQPMQANLRPGDRRRFVPYGGRPSDKVMPFFNLAAGGDRSGLFLGIGWTGEWAATFARNDAGATALSAGIRQMRASLQPGEEIRTPSILLMAWRANDSAEGHNQFRRLLLEHFTPRIAGKPVVPPISAGPHAIISFEKTTEANLLECIANISEHNLPVDNFWLDAGWYACPQDPSGWDKTTGTWTPDPERFPRGLRPIADAAKQHGFRPVLYDIPRGCAAAYYPETNVLVAIDEHAVKSFTPMSKYIEVTLLPCA